MSRGKQLHDAVVNNDLETATSLLVSGVNPNKLSASAGAPVLRTACERNNLAMVKLLVTNPHKPADPNIRGSNDVWIIIEAAEDNNTALVKLLAQEALVKVNLEVAHGGRPTPLISAVRKNNAGMVKVLLEAGANPNLFITGVQIDSPLIAAVETNSIPISRLLMENCCNANLSLAAKHRNFSAMHSALNNGELVMIKYLVEEAEADIFAVQGMFLEHAITLDKSKVLDYLLQHAYNLRGNDISWFGSAQHRADDEDAEFCLAGFPLHRAVDVNAESCVAVLLRWGINNVIPSGSVFELAVRYGRIKSINMLKKLNPQYLQEDWLLQKQSLSWYENKYIYLEEISKERKNPPRLDVLCRAEILYELGYNPVSKAENLPLPRMLIDFVQGKDIDGLHT